MDTERRPSALDQSNKVTLKDFVALVNPKYENLLPYQKEMFMFMDSVPKGCKLQQVTRRRGGAYYIAVDSCGETFTYKGNGTWEKNIT